MLHYAACFSAMIWAWGAAPLVAAAEPESTEPTLNWPSFRGPRASGVGIGCKPPIHWDTRTGQNTLWKTAIPGLGLGSPVIWKDRVFVTTAISGKKNDDLRIGLYGDIKPVEDKSVHQWKLYCLDRATGRIIWENIAHEGKPAIKRHTKASHANSTPATNGECVIAFFGSEGLYCYEMSGELRWKKTFGKLDSGYYVVPEAQWGFGSSPVIHKDRVIIQCDVQKNSFLAAFNIKNGNEIWRTPRRDVPTWSTPTICENNGRTLVLVNGHQHMGAYDFESGEEAWRLHGGGDIPVPTPVIWRDLAFFTSAHGGAAPLFAVRLNARGDVSLDGDEDHNEYIAWHDPMSASYMQTPLVLDDLIYTSRDNGVMTCYQAADGKQLYRERLGGGQSGFTASAVAADGRLYYTSEEGDVYVIKAGPKFELLATNGLGEACMSTPAISGNLILFRTQRHVMSIGSRKP